VPEQNREPRGPYAFTLLAAFEQGRLVRVRCGSCNIRRVYDPGDLKQLVGDVGTEGVRNRMRCEKCSSQEWLSVEFWIPTAQELEGLTVRRLVGTRMIRKVIWRDGPARR
jgi:hypothetical protein